MSQGTYWLVNSKAGNPTWVTLHVHIILDGKELAISEGQLQPSLGQNPLQLPFRILFYLPSYCTFRTLSCMA